MKKKSMEEITLYALFWESSMGHEASDISAEVM